MALLQRISGQRLFRCIGRRSVVVATTRLSPNLADVHITGILLSCSIIEVVVETEDFSILKTILTLYFVLQEETEVTTTQTLNIHIASHLQDVGAHRAILCRIKDYSTSTVTDTDVASPQLLTVRPVTLLERLVTSTIGRPFRELHLTGSARDAIELSLSILNGLILKVDVNEGSDSRSRNCCLIGFNSLIQFSIGSHDGSSILLTVVNSLHSGLYVLGLVNGSLEFSLASRSLIETHTLHKLSIVDGCLDRSKCVVDGNESLVGSDDILHCLLINRINQITGLSCGRLHIIVLIGSDDSILIQILVFHDLFLNRIYTSLQFSLAPEILLIIKIFYSSINLSAASGDLLTDISLVAQLFLVVFIVVLTPDRSIGNISYRTTLQILIGILTIGLEANLIGTSLFNFCGNQEWGVNS